LLGFCLCPDTETLNRRIQTRNQEALAAGWAAEAKALAAAFGADAVKATGAIGYAELLEMPESLAAPLIELRTRNTPGASAPGSAGKPPCNGPQARKSSKRPWSAFMPKLSVNILSESEGFEAQGVHTAFVDMVEALKKRDDIDVLVNSKEKAELLHAHTFGPRVLAAPGPYKGRRLLTAHVVPGSFIGSLALAGVLGADLGLVPQGGLQQRRRGALRGAPGQARPRKCRLYRHRRAPAGSCLRPFFRPDTKKPRLGPVGSTSMRALTRSFRGRA